MAHKLIAFTILLIASGYTIAPGCENCGCCVDKVCATAFVQGKYVENRCTLGCIDGYGGNKCYNKCPDGCVTCEQIFHKNCSTCEAGKYLKYYPDIYSKRCVDCQAGCRKCISAKQCQECYPFYYNGGDVTNCSLRCPENCLCQHVGICSSCQEGFYSTSSHCQGVCPVVCKTCTDQGGFDGLTCSECITGRYGHTCNDWCPSTCKDKKCNKNTGQCFSCQIGFYGPVCEQNCSEGCKNNECDFETGSCIECVPSYSGNKCCIQYGFCKNCSSNTICKTCADGYYGDVCNKACPSMCKLENGTTECERTTGICTGCGDGFHGDFCKSVCSYQCLNNQCFKDNGHCSDGCLNGYEGATCTALTKDFSATGIAVGISSAVTIVVVTIAIFVSFIILRKWFRNVNERMRQHHEPYILASYENTELQSVAAIPTETVQSGDNDDQCEDKEYEELNECNPVEEADYDPIL